MPKHNFALQDHDRSLHGGAIVRRRAVPPLGDLAHGRTLPHVGDNDHERRVPLHEVRRRPRKVNGQRGAAAGKCAQNKNEKKIRKKTV